MLYRTNYEYVLKLLPVLFRAGTRCSTLLRSAQSYGDLAPN